MAIQLDVNEIKKILPHRFPMLLVDRILDLEPMKWAVGLKTSRSTKCSSSVIFRTNRLCRASS